MGYLFKNEEGEMTTKMLLKNQNRKPNKTWVDNGS